MLKEKLNLEIGEWYPVSDIRLRLQIIYEAMNINKGASSTDILLFYIVNEQSKILNNKLTKGYTIIKER